MGTFHSGSSTKQISRFCERLLLGLLQWSSFNADHVPKNQLEYAAQVRLIENRTIALNSRKLKLFAIGV